MSSIDERVVEMQFDNDQFESGIKQSTDSLDKLKDSLDLDGASKGLDNVSKTVSQFTMDGVTTAVETSSHSFSALETVATAALVNITSQAVQAGEQLLASLSVDQISAGYDKYTQKLSNVQTIMNSTGESVDTVNGYMDHLMWYSDETSYGFTDMTTALANMVSVGGEVDSLIPMIEGVANATAYAGQNATAFSYVMSAINSGYSRGYMQATDWARIEHQNAASKELKTTLIETAESLGKLEEGEVTLENFKSTLSTGKWLDTEVLEQGFSVFSEMTEAAYDLIEAGEYDTATEAYAALESEYGDIAVAAAEAAQQAKTFGEAIDATKDAVSSKWSDIMQSIFGDYDQATQLWTDVSEELYDIFAEPLGNFGEKIAEAFGGDGTAWSNITDQIEEAGVSANAFEEALNSVAEAQGLDALVEECGSVEEAFSSLTVEEKASWISAAIDELCTSTEVAGTSMEELGDIVTRVVQGEFGDGEERIQALTEAGYDYATVQEAVNLCWQDGVLSLDALSDEELEALGYSEETIAALRELQDALGDTSSEFYQALMTMDDGMSGFEALWGGLANIGSIIEEIGGAIAAAWRDVFPEITAEQIRSSLQSFYETTKSALSGVEDAVTNVQSVFRGLFSILATGKDIVVSVAKAGFNVLQKALGNCNIDLLGMLGNVGDLIYSFRQWFTENEIAQKITDGLTNALTSLGKTVISLKDKFLELPSVKSAIEKVTKFGDSLYESFKNAFPKTAAWIEAFINQFKNLGNLNFSFLSHAFSNFGKELKANIIDMFPETSAAITNFVDKFKEDFSSITFDDVIDIFTSFKDELVAKVNGFIDNNEFLSGIRDSLTSFFDSFKQGISDGLASIGVDLDEFLETIKGFKDKVVEAVEDVLKSLGLMSDDSELNGMHAMSEPLDLFGDRLELLSESAEEVTSPLQTLKDTLSSFKDSVTTGISNFFDTLGNIDVGKIISVASAIVVLVGAFKLITSIFNISSCITNITKSLRDMTSAFKMSSFGTSMLEIAGAVGILAISLAALAQLPTDKLLESAGVIVAVVGALTALTKLTGNAVSSGLGNLGTLAGVAIALLAVVEALNMLDGIEINGSLIAKIGIIAGAIIGLVAAVKSINKVTGTLKGGVGNMAEMIGLAISLKLVISALQDITEIDYTVGDVLALVGIFAALAGAMKILGGVTGGWASIGSAATLLAIPLAMKMMLSALDDIADYDTNKLLDSIENFVIILGEMAGLAVVSRIAGSGGGVSMLAMAASVMIMAGAIAMLGNLDENSMQNGLAAVETLILTMGTMSSLFALVNKIPGGSSGATSILSMAAAIAVMALAVAGLSLVDPTSLQNATTAMMELMSIFSLMEGFSAFTKLSSTSGILSLVAAVGVIALALGGLSTVDPGNVSNAADAISQLGLVFSAMEVASAFTKSSSIAGILSLTVVIGVIGTVLGLLANLTDPGDVASIADSLTECMLAFSAALAVCSVAGMASGAALAGLGTMLAVIGVLTVVLVALSSIAGLIEGTKFGDNMISGMEYIGEFFGAIAGAFAGKVISTVASALAGAAEDLNTISTALAPLGDTVKTITKSFSKVDSSCLDNIDTFADIILKLSEASLIESISSFISGSSSYEQLGDGLAKLAKVMSKFGDLCSELNMDGIQQGLDAIDKLNTAQGSLQKVGGIAQVFTGIQEWDSLSNGLKELGKAMKSFANSMDGVTIDETSITAITNLATAQNSIQKVGGIADIMGTHEWSTLSTGLVEMGQALADFSSTVSGGIDADSMSTAIKALNALSDSQGSIEKAGGVVQDLVGETEWSTLSTGLVEMGQALVDFSSTVSGGIDADSMSTAIKALSALSDAQGSIEKAGGVIQDLVGETEWSTLSTGLIEMGSALAGFSAAVSYGDGIDADNVTNAIKAISALASAQGDVQTTGGAFDWLFGNSDWSTLSTDLEGLGEGLVGLSTAGATLNMEAIDKSVQAIETVSQLGSITTGYSGSYDWIVENLGDLGTTITSFGSEISSITWPDNMDQLSEILVSIGDASKKVSGMDKGGQLPKVLDEVGSALVKFANSFKGVTIPDLSELTAMTTAIADASSAVKGMNQEQLSNILLNVGSSLKKFATGMQDVEIPDMSDLTSLVRIIAKSSDEVRDMDSFQLSTILDNVKEALNGFSDVTLPDNSEEIVNVIQSISDACETADGINTDNISTMFTGITDAVAAFDNFEFPDISDSLTQFIDSITSVDDWPTDFSSISGCATALQDACTAFEDFEFPDLSEDISAFIESISSDAWPTEFGDISASATAMETACQEFETIEFPDLSEDISAFITSFTSDSWPTEFADIDACFTALQSAIDQFGDINFPSTSTLSSFATELSSALDGAGDAGGQAMIDALLSYEGQAGDAGVTLITDVADGMNNTVSSVTGACDSICQAALNTINSYQGSFSGAGSALIQAMASGMSGATGSVTGAVAGVCNAAVSTAGGYANSMYSAGLNMAQGYANGIAAGTNAAVNAAANMAAQAVAAANSAQESHSPSRVTFRSGMWFDQGYANGIVAFIPLIKTAAENVADAAANSLSGEMDSMANLISDEMNLNPVITPVLDLSQVRSGAASLNGMLLTTPTLSIDTGQVNRVSGSVSAYQASQMNPNSDLLNAIEGLNAGMSDRRGNTYNVNGITYDDGTNVAAAVQQLFRAMRLEGRA